LNLSSGTGRWAPGCHRRPRAPLCV